MLVRVPFLRGLIYAGARARPRAWRQGPTWNIALPLAALRRTMLIAVFSLAMPMLIGCSQANENGGSGPHEVDVSSRCADFTPLVRGGPRDPFPAARIGQLWFSDLGAGPYASILLVPGVPTKVPISVVKPLHGSLTLRGSSCGDGTPLRFWYREPGWYERPGPFRLPMSPASMSDQGDLTAVLHDRPRTWTYAGYMLFTSPGRWRIEIHEGSVLTGSLVIDVVDSEQESPATRPSPVPLMLTPPSVLRESRRSGLEAACPRRLPRVRGWSAYASDGPTPMVSLEHGGEERLSIPNVADRRECSIS